MSTKHSQNSMDKDLPLIVEVMKKNHRIIYKASKIASSKKDYNRQSFKKFEVEGD